MRTAAILAIMADPDVMYCRHGMRWFGVNTVDGHTFEASSAPALHGLIAGYYQVDPATVRMHRGDHPGPAHPVVVVDHGLARAERGYAHQLIVRTCTGHALRLSVERYVAPRESAYAAAELWTANGWVLVTAIPPDTAALAALPIRSGAQDEPGLPALTEAVAEVFELLYRDALVVLGGMAPATPPAQA